MKLSIGITGLANVGKSTLFEALTKIPVNISNYPFTTIEPNVGIVAVPDSRLEQIAKVCNSKEIVPTVIEFVDIAGLVRGAHKGEGLGNQFLARIREVDVVLHIVRAFVDELVIHVEKTVDPVRDIDIVNTELILKDLETISKRIENVEPDVKGNKKEAKIEFEVLKELKEAVSAGKSARFLLQNLDEDKKKIVAGYSLLSAKPQIYLLNSKDDNITSELKTKMENLGADYLIMNLRDELEMTDLTEKERIELEMKSKLNELTEKCYKVLDIITFFTIKGEKTQAWTIKRRTKIIDAASEIHTDFAEKFAKAEVINWQTLVERGGWKQSQEKGILRTEGRDYIVQEGDVIEIKI